jgi:hypothetical protein
MQLARLFNFLRSNKKQGVSSLDIIKQCKIVNTTGRISDLRKKGCIIEAKKICNIWKFFFKNPEAFKGFDAKGVFVLAKKVRRKNVLA